MVAVHPGDDYRISASWELHRGGGDRLFLDFDGLSPDGDVCLPLTESYGCHARGRSRVGLYFGRVSRSREHWERELAEFVRSLDTVPSAEANT